MPILDLEKRKAIIIINLTEIQRKEYGRIAIKLVISLNRDAAIRLEQVLR
jgi:hypothetical protein